MKFIKTIWILIAFCFSALFADTGDWKTAITLVSNQPGNDEINHHGINWIVSSYVDINGIHVFYDDGTTQPGGGYWKVATFDVDGTSLYSHNVTSDIVHDSQIDGNDDAIFVVWVDHLDIGDSRYGRMRAKISTNGGETWSSTYSKTLAYIGPKTAGYAVMHDLSISCDDDGVHAGSIPGSTTPPEVSGVEYCFLPNDADNDNDWVWVEKIPDERAVRSDCDDNGFAIEAINDYGASSYDNIFLAYCHNDGEGYLPMRGQISTDDGSNWGEKDDIDADDQGKSYGIDMAFDGDNFFCVWTIDAGATDSLAYSYRPAKGSSSYSGTWSSKTYIPDVIHVNKSFDVCSRDDGYIDLVYGMPSDLKYRKISTSSPGTAETIVSSGRYYPDITNHNDIFVVYRTNHKMYSGHIYMQYRDATPITPHIALSWIGKPKLDWPKPCFDVKDYKIYKTSRDRWVYVGRTSNLYWTDNYFSSRTSYKIKSIDNDNNESDYSNIVTCYLPIGGEKSLSTEYVLHNAYPNPFNPTTTIKFNLPEDGFVNISIYNLLGEMVGNPVNGQMTAGKHQIQFDGSNLSSGIYFIRMNSKQFVKTQKIILTK